MFSLKLISRNRNLKSHKYYKCNRCGYISIIRNTNCPICAKDGHRLKMK